MFRNKSIAYLLNNLYIFWYKQVIMRLTQGVLAEPFYVHWWTEITNQRAFDTKIDVIPSDGALIAPKKPTKSTWTSSDWGPSLSKIRTDFLAGSNSLGTDTITITITANSTNFWLWLAALQMNSLRDPPRLLVPQEGGRGERWSEERWRKGGKG